MCQHKENFLLQNNDVFLCTFTSNGVYITTIVGWRQGKEDSQLHAECFILWAAWFVA
jgi:hypothetical protein